MRIRIIKIGTIVAVIAVLFVVLNMGRSVKVEVYEATRGDIADYIEDIGTVMSRNEVTIASRVTGKIKSVNFQEGDMVKEGDVLLEIDSTELELYIKGLYARMEGLKASYSQAVDPVKIEQARIKVNSAKISLEEAKRQAENNKKLYEEGGISSDAYERSLMDLKQKENELKIAESELSLLEKGISGSIRSQHEAQIAQLAYEIESYEAKREDYIIKSPIDGMIMDVKIKAGDLVQIGSGIMEIGNLEYFIKGEVLASEAGKIKEGAKVIIEREDMGLERFEGRVEKIYPKAFSKISDLGIEQKRVRVDISMENAALNLRPGDDVDIRILKDEANDVVLVPDDSVFQLDGQNYVFVIENGRAVLRMVEIGLEGEEFVEVKEGVNEGERVILSPDEKIKEGIKVTVL